MLGVFGLPFFCTDAHHVSSTSSSLTARGLKGSGKLVVVHPPLSPFISNSTGSSLPASPSQAELEQKWARTLEELVLGQARTCTSYS